MLDPAFLLKVSRPRFWIYILGPFILGAAAAAQYAAQLDWQTVVFGVYFLFPANLLVYGVNDIFDYETDKLNTKKAKYEELVTPERQRPLAMWIAIINLPFYLLAISVLGLAVLPLAAFLFFSIFYSAPPIRAKAIPFVDSAFNILYVLPGVVAYRMVAGVMPPWTLMLAGGLWTAAMHAFSAIPDIESDRRAGLSTIATTLGWQGTHLFCLAAYVGSALVSYEYLHYFSLAAAGVYAIMMLLSLAANGRDGVFRIYRMFPIVNALIGFALFLDIAFAKLLLCFMVPCDPSPFR